MIRNERHFLLYSNFGILLSMEWNNLLPNCWWAGSCEQNHRHPNIFFSLGFYQLTMLDRDFSFASDMNINTMIVVWNPYFILITNSQLLCQLSVDGVSRILRLSLINIELFSSRSSQVECSWVEIIFILTSVSCSYRVTELQRSTVEFWGDPEKFTGSYRVLLERSFHRCIL